MKISIITLHSQNNNFGTVLQAYALNKYLTNNGYDVETIDYRPFYSNGGNNIKFKIKILLVDLLFLPCFVSRNKKFNALINSVNLTRRYKSFDEIKRNPPESDIYLTGSDQIWNPNYLCGNDDSYYLKFTNSRNKIAFSSSIGVELNQNDLNKFLKKIEDFQYIGVREEVSFNQLSNHKKNIKHVCDTVFLLNQNDYCKLEKSVNNLKDKKYVLVYCMEKSPIIDEAVNFFKKNTNFKIVSIGGFRKKCNYDYFIRNAGPSEFLYLFHNASYVLTSSFHGTAFSMIYNKQFFCVRPQKSNERLKSILKKVDLENRFISNDDEFMECLKNPIDFNSVNYKLDKFIIDSKKFLEDEIKGVIKNG